MTQAEQIPVIGITPEVFTLTIDGVAHAGFKVTSVWEGMAKFQRDEQVVIVASPGVEIDQGLKLNLGQAEPVKMSRSLRAAPAVPAPPPTPTLPEAQPPQQQFPVEPPPAIAPLPPIESQMAPIVAAPPPTAQIISS